MNVGKTEDETNRSIYGERPGTTPGTNEQFVPARPDSSKTGIDLSQLVPANPLPFRRTIRRTELRQIVPLANTTIYDMERRGEFPRRFYLTSRCVVWDLAEVDAWVEARRQAANAAQTKRAPTPDVRRRKRRPVKAAPAS
jgi:prophage regulatory protein